MKTREELLVKIKTEFEKDRKKNVRQLRYLLPFWLCLIAVLALEEIKIIHDLFSGVFSKEHGYGIVALMIFVALLILFLLWGLVYVLPRILYTEDYNIVHLKEIEQKSIAHIEQKKSDLEEQLVPIRTKAKSQQAFVEWLQSDDVHIITPEPIWPSYIVTIAKNSANNLKAQKHQLEKVLDELLEAQVRLEFYDMVAEKTFWQYIKSKKWLKKLNS